MRDENGAQAQSNGAANGRRNTEDRIKSMDGRRKRIAEEKIQSADGRKTFFLDLVENTRGRVLHVTEDVNGRRDRVMIDLADLREIGEIILRMADWSEKNPA